MTKPILPDRVLTELDDQTGLTSFQFMKMAPGIRYCDVVIVKASFAITGQGISPIALPGEIIWADEHRDAEHPLGSSLKCAGDLVLVKPGADVILTGSVHTDKPRTHFVSQVQLLDAQGKAILLNYACDITGPRQWYTNVLGIWHMSEPQPCTAVPIEYELSYGGRQAHPKEPEDDWVTWATNPSGSGFSFEHLRWTERAPAIQWERRSLVKSLKQDELTGFGPVARFWQSRTQYAGTYGKEWQAKLDEAVKREDHLKGPVIMDYAPDFNLKFFQAAHPKLQTDKPLQGGEWLWLKNIIQGQTMWKGQIPELGITAHYKHPQKGLIKQAFKLDTVHVDTTAQTISLTWRLHWLHAEGVTSVQIRRRMA